MCKYDITRVLVGELSQDTIGNSSFGRSIAFYLKFGEKLGIFNRIL